MLWLSLFFMHKRQVSKELIQQYQNVTALHQLKQPSHWGLCMCMMIISYIFHFSYRSHTYWKGKTSFTLFCSNMYVKTMIDDIQWLRGISFNDICSTSMGLLITTTRELRKKPLKMTADKYNEKDLWIAYFKGAHPLWSRLFVSFIMLLWHENSIMLFWGLNWVNVRDSLPRKIINTNHPPTELSGVLDLHSCNVSGKQDVFRTQQKGYQLINSRIQQEHYVALKSKPFLNPIIWILTDFIPAKFLY